MRRRNVVCLALLLGACVVLTAPYGLASAAESADLEEEDDAPDPESDDDVAASQSPGDNWVDGNDASDAAKPNRGDSIDEDDDDDDDGGGSAAAAAQEAQQQQKKRKKRVMEIPDDLETPLVPLTTDELLQKYLYEVIASGFVVLYIINFIYGRFVNSGMAYAWHAASNKTNLWQEAFAHCSHPTRLYCESYALYKFQCSGREHCTAFNVELALKPRMDLISTIWDILSPTPDLCNIEIPIRDGSMPPCVWTLCRKRDVARVKDIHKDVASQAPKQTTVSGLPDQFTILTDCREVTENILLKNAPEKGQFGKQILDTITQYKDLVQLIKISDDDKVVTGGSKANRRILRLSFRLPASRKKMDAAMDTLMRLAVHLISVVGTMKLSVRAKASHGKAKEVKEAEDAKKLHQKRMEEAQMRKLEARAKEYESMYDKSPEEQRKLQEKMQKEEMKAMRKRATKVVKR